LKVFKIHTNKKPLKDVDLDELATMTEGYSGAEIAAVCNESALKALEEIMSRPMSDEEVIEASRDACITRDHFKQALNIVQPRINRELLQVYEKFQQKNNRS
jgi:transitional endoplasmic reticulum ATPase